MLDAEPDILPDEKGTDAVKVVAGIDGMPKGLTLGPDAIAPELSLEAELDKQRGAVQCTTNVPSGWERDGRRLKRR